jgi:hypothetical protein
MTDRSTSALLTVTGAICAACFACCGIAALAALLLASPHASSSWLKWLLLLWVVSASVPSVVTAYHLPRNPWLTEHQRHDWQQQMKWGGLSVLAAFAYALRGGSPLRGRPTP